MPKAWVGKLPKEQQVDLQGEEVDTNAPEGWTVDGPRIRDLIKDVIRIAGKIPELRQTVVAEEELQIVIAHRAKRTGKQKAKQNWHTFAQILKPRSIFGAIAEAQDCKLGPFVIEFFPVYFKEPKERQEQIIIHELYHIKVNPTSGKKSLRPHWGFGDDDVEQLHRKYLQ